MLAIASSWLIWTLCITLESKIQVKYAYTVVASECVAAVALQNYYTDHYYSPDDINQLFAKPHMGRVSASLPHLRESAIFL